VAAATQVVAEFLEARGGFEIGIVVVEQLAHFFEVVGIEIVFRQFGGILDGNHFHLQFEAAAGAFEEILPAEVT